MVERLFRASKTPRTRPGSVSSVDDSLRTTVAILRAQQEATRDGILVVSQAPETFLSVNRRFFEIWRIPPSLAATQDDNRLLAFAESMVRDPQEFLSEVAYLYDRDREVRTDDEYH